MPFPVWVGIPVDLFPEVLPLSPVELEREVIILDKGHVLEQASESDRRDSDSRLETSGIQSPALPANVAPTPTSLPTATPIPKPSIHPAVKSSLHVHGRSALRIVVTSGKSAHQTLTGAKVVLDARSVGLSSLLHRSSDRKGIASFSNLSLRRAGPLKISVSKAGYKTAHKILRVKP